MMRRLELLVALVVAALAAGGCARVCADDHLSVTIPITVVAAGDVAMAATVYQVQANSSTTDAAQAPDVSATVPLPIVPSLERSPYVLLELEALEDRR